MKGATKLFKAIKPIAQLALLVIGISMVCFGVMRGEADAVLAKAIRLCLECVGIG
ncbi:CD1871A family CXXC motif-containing protein [Olegusella massiliensis]|uniref:CD1871A family CXXC motif-containing protein n=1 Tax=Olegusella massiliensis TaxID=1776381 RepID=UPI000687A023